MSSSSTTKATTKLNLNAVRKAPKFSGLLLFAAAFETLGIIYSDLGTSPLYTLNGIWPSSGPVPPKEDVIGGLSAIVWSLTLVPLLKYAFVCLRFGTKEGEGGTFALYHGLYPPKDRDIDADRTLTGDTVFTGQEDRSAFRNSFMAKIRWPLMVWALFGMSLTMADGILTPAVSVTSAVVGMAVARPSVTNDVVPISIAFLVAFFLVQQFGTSRIAIFFAPITFLWLALIGITGIVNIVSFPGIFRAFDPSRAVLLFTRTHNYDLLAGVLLALTGSEAMFANLGQFNMASIQIAFGGFVYPCLVLAYLGQGARLIKDGEAVLGNVFYLTIPGKPNGPLFWVVYVAAILATITASQALVSATFSLVQQVVNMRSLPHIPMVHTSDTIQGQIYFPLVNYALMVATIVIVAVFKTSTSLTNAYGFAVATVMITTSVLLSFQIRVVKKKPIIFALAFFLFFGFIDGLFWGASLKKVPHGAWVPLMIGLILVTLMVFWTWAKGLEDSFDGANRKNLRHFIMKEADNRILTSTTAYSDDAPGEEQGIGTYDDAHAAALYYIAHVIRKTRSENDVESLESLESVDKKRELVRIPTCAVFHKLTPGQGVPHSFIGFIRQWPALPCVVIFLSVHVLPIPHVGLGDRYQITKVHTIQGFYGVTYCLGFRDDFEVKVDEVINHICNLEMSLDPRASRSILNEIRYASEISTHIVPHYHVVSKRVKAGILSATLSWVRALLVEGIYRRTAAMFPETENWLGSADEIIHVGINVVV